MIREANLLWQYQDTDSGLIMPYYALPCLEWLKQQELKNWSVFEYGCGYSTIWLRLNTKYVESVDSSESWGAAMGAWYTDDKSLYLTQVAKKQNYDCIIVDGDPIEWRPDCVEFCRDFLKPGGYLIIDNFDQEGFPPAIAYEKFLEGWERQVFAQPNHSSWKTAVFTKPK